MPSKILVITHPEVDYGASFLFDGLCEVFGDSNVYEYPPKPPYHGVRSYYSTPAIADGRTDPVAWARNPPSPYPVGSDPIAFVQEGLRTGFFDCVFIESVRTLAMRDARILQPSHYAPTVLQEAEDWQELQPALDYCNELGCKVLLKRELTRPLQDEQVHGGVTVLGMPFASAYGAIQQALAKAAPKPHYDVVFICGNSHPEREYIAGMVTHKLPTRYSHYILLYPDPRSLSTPGARLWEWHDYIRIIANAKVAITTRGYGFDTVRFWESVSLTCTVSGVGNLVHSHPYIPNETCYVYSTPEDGLAKIIYALENADVRERVQQAGIAHTLAHHTCAQRVRYMVGRLRTLGICDLQENATC